MIYERIVNCKYKKDIDELDRLYATEDLIRCEDCKYGEPCKNALGENCVICKNPDAPWLDNILIMPNWYCADGERREENDEA